MFVQSALCPACGKIMATLTNDLIDNSAVIDEDLFVVPPVFEGLVN